MYTIGWNQIILLDDSEQPLSEILRKNRKITPENERLFFETDFSDLHDPYLLPDMEKAVTRILEAREKKERIVIFGDYDVDGVSSTAILVRFLTEIGCLVSYRLPHRVHDGYGLKEYFFDELAEKNVKLVITVDCGTRDIWPIRHAKSLGIDVIVTDHHAVPAIIPEEVIALINPKRTDSIYPFRDLAGAGVAFKLLHAIVLKMQDTGTQTHTQMSQNTIPEWEKNSNVSSVSVYVENTLQNYIDFASLGTVSDCMPIIGENRTIVTLGLRQMSQSKSRWLRKFLEWHHDRNSQKRSNSSENQVPKRTVSGNTVSEDTQTWTWRTSFSEFLDADLIGFQIWPRINAAGRMDTPITALQWLLAGEDRVDTLFEELEHLNETRKWTTEHHLEKALLNVDTSKPILFYDAHDLEHGVIGLVAGKLTEMYNKPSIVLKNGHDHPLTSRKGDEVLVEESPLSIPLTRGTQGVCSESREMNPPTPLVRGAETLNILPTQPSAHPTLSIASCRSPEWCNIIELLESCREYFIRFGGHRQAAGFTIETARLEELKTALFEKFAAIHDVENLPKKTIDVECILDAQTDLTLENITIIDRFRPFGIGNRKPLFLLQDETILECSPLGREGKHLQLRLASNPDIKLVAWWWGKEWKVKSEKWRVENSSPEWQMRTTPDYIDLLQPGNIISLIVELDRNVWNGKESVSVVVKDVVAE